MSIRKRVLITGSGGMLGVDLSCELSRSYDIYGIDIIAQPTDCQIAEFQKCDITDAKAVAGIIKDVRPDIVIHTAAMTDVDGCELDKEKTYKINSEGTKNVAIACKETDSILIYISTDFVFDGKKKAPYKEEDIPNPLNVYADSKLKGEVAVKAVLKRYFIIRTGWLYGRHGKNFVDTILAKAKTENTLKIVDDQKGSPTYTKDLAKAIHVLLDKVFTKDPERSVQYGTYHVSNSGSVSWYEYTRAIVQLAGMKTPVTPISSAELGRTARRPAMSILDNSKFIKLTHYRMRDWKEALKGYILNVGMTEAA